MRYPKKTLLSRITIQKWICAFAEENSIDVVSKKEKGKNDGQDIARTSEPIPDGEEKALRTEIKRLERELRKQKLRADLNEEIINVAERKFNIQIRKKAGIKR